MVLSPVEGRVVGCLVEKQLATPQQYPLTRNALLLACNQTSNRDPVVAFSEEEVVAALEQLKGARLVRFVLPSHGRSVVRYRHVLDEVLGLDPAQLALLAVLLLRGPQTAAELRARAGRLAEVGSVEHDLGLLADRADPLVARQPRRPGEREERWATLLAASPGPAIEAAAAGSGDAPPGVDPSEAAATGAPGAPSGTAGLPRAGATDTGGVGLDGGVRAELAELRADVEDLRREMAALRTDLAELRDSLGG